MGFIGYLFHEIIVIFFERGKLKSNQLFFIVCLSVFRRLRWFRDILRYCPSWKLILMCLRVHLFCLWLELFPFFLLFLWFLFLGWSTLKTILCGNHLSRIRSLITGKFRPEYFVIIGFDCCLGHFRCHFVSIPRRNKSRMTVFCTFLYSIDGGNWRFLFNDR